jgi:hypothetical protein
MDKNKNSRGRRELTLARIVVCHNKNLEAHIKKRKEMVRTGQNKTRLGTATVLP